MLLIDDRKSSFKSSKQSKLDQFKYVLRFFKILKD